MPFVAKHRKKSVFLRLEGCAKRFTGRYRTVRSYRNLVCGAIGVTVVVIAILNVALDPLDVLASTAAFVVLVLFHFSVPFVIPIAKVLSSRKHYCTPSKHHYV